MERLAVYAPREIAWWTLAENFQAPLAFCIEEDLEEFIFGPRDIYLRCIEEHSYTLIQLQKWFTASGQTRVTIVGPLPARQWLMEMIWSVGSWDSYQKSRGRVMLQVVRSQPLTQRDLEASFRIQPSIWNLAFANRMNGTISLEVLPGYLCQLFGCLRFFWSSLYP